MMNILKNLTIEGSNHRPMLVDVFTKMNNTKKPVVIFIHGFKGFKDWGCWDLVGKTFAENDFVFLKFNFSHNGTTKSNPLEFDDLEAFGNNNFTKELFDIEKILDKVANGDIGIPLNEFSRTKIYVIGHSRGAGVAAIKAQEDTRIKSLVSWAGQMNFEKYFLNLEEWKTKGVRYLLNGRTFQEMPLYWQFAEDYLANSQRFMPEKMLNLLQIPLFFGYGAEDNVVSPIDFCILKVKNASNRCFFIAEANHVFNGSHPYNETVLPLALNDLLHKTIEFFECL